MSSTAVLLLGSVAVVEVGVDVATGVVEMEAVGVEVVVGVAALAGAGMLVVVVAVLAGVGSEVVEMWRTSTTGSVGWDGGIVSMCCSSSEAHNFAMVFCAHSGNGPD